VNWKVRTTLIGAAAALAATVTVAQAADPSGAAAGSSDQLEFNLDEFKISPKAAEAKAGTVRIKAKNTGDGEHELVVARTKRKPGKLPTSKNGDVKEGRINVIGEISELPPGEAGKTRLHLKSGKYVMFCNVPGHYAQGMYGKLTVK
jgi:uncharacterized cupredoxin-like copper-binding protein